MSRRVSVAARPGRQLPGLAFRRVVLLQRAEPRGERSAGGFDPLGHYGHIDHRAGSETSDGAAILSELDQERPHLRTIGPGTVADACRPGHGLAVTDLDTLIGDLDPASPAHDDEQRDP